VDSGPLRYSRRTCLFRVPYACLSPLDSTIAAALEIIDVPLLIPGAVNSLSDGPMVRWSLQRTRPCIAVRRIMSRWPLSLVDVSDRNSAVCG